MKRLERCGPFSRKWREFYAENRAHGFTKDAISDTFKHLKRCEYWKNDQYQVAIDKETEGNTTPMRVWHLSIKRLDKQPIHDWRDLQEIKNQLIGPECEALELYPAESRLMDTANQFHLWAFPDGEFIPFGYQTPRVVTDKGLGDAVQRPRMKDRPDV